MLGKEYQELAAKAEVIVSEQNIETKPSLLQVMV